MTASLWWGYNHAAFNTAAGPRNSGIRDGTPGPGKANSVGRHANRRPARSNSVQPISPDIRHTASASQDAGPAADYPRFYAAVALAQLTSWLPTAPELLIDISGPGSRAAEVAVRAGHSVLRVVDPRGAARRPLDRAGKPGRARAGWLR